MTTQDIRALHWSKALTTLISWQHAGLNLYSGVPALQFIFSNKKLIYLYKYLGYLWFINQNKCQKVVSTPSFHVRVYSDWTWVTKRNLWFPKAELICTCRAYLINFIAVFGQLPSSFLMIKQAYNKYPTLGSFLAEGKTTFLLNVSPCVVWEKRSGRMRNCISCT